MGCVELVLALSGGDGGPLFVRALWEGGLAKIYERDLEFYQSPRLLLPNFCNLENS